MNAPEAGVVTRIEPGIRMLLAPNPGPMTHWGTNTFIFGEGSVAVIDPGPEDSAHLEAILSATWGETITHILVTHAHADHSPLARALSRQTGAGVFAFGPPEAGRSERMQSLARDGLAGGGEGIDLGFAPDVAVVEGDRIEGAGWALDVLHTPGHFAGHLAFQSGDTVFSGDHVMDWSSSLVSPPDGDISPFMATSARLRDLGARRLLPGHGGAINDPADRLGWLIAHREARGRAILDALTANAETIETITTRVYSDIPNSMLRAAARNVFAHLIDLVDKGQARAAPELSPLARYSRI